VAVIDEKAINIFTDGSSYSHPRRGGLGMVFVWVDEKGIDQSWECVPIGYSGATNNQMELQACIDGLKEIIQNRTPFDSGNFSKIIIFSDSQYVVDNWKNAVYIWSRNKWFKGNGSPVQNAESWIQLLKLIKKVGKRVDFKWIKGHKDNEYNKMADKLAKNSAKKAGDQKISIVRVRRKLSNKATELGSVILGGQKINIRIITDELMRKQKCYKYRYEVMSKRSDYYQCVDIIFSEIMLSAGHVYCVRVNSDQKNPRVVKLFKECVK